MATNQPTSQTGAVICAGLFFLVTGDTVSAHIIPSDEVGRFYVGTRFARQSRDPETAMLNLVRATFRVKDDSFALPAHSLESLAFYLDHYEGPAQDAVRGLAASWITGPFNNSSDDDGGVADRIPAAPTPPPAPVGSDQPENSKPQLAMQPQTTPIVDLDALLALAR